MKLKICAISDLHGNLPLITEPADILLIGGDISPLHIQFNKPKMKEWLENEFANWIRELPVDDVYLVAGNHDSYFENITKGNETDFWQACDHKLNYLCNEDVIHYDKFGQKWKIFGTPYCHIFGNWPFMREDEYMEAKFKTIPDDVDIIISHDPPFAFGDCDVVLGEKQWLNHRVFTHLGNAPLAKRIKDMNYKLLVCGHIHSGDHDFNEAYRCANVSILDEDYRENYKPFYIEIQK